MVARSNNENLRLALIIQIALALILFFWFLAITTNAQTISSNAQTTGVKTAPEVTKPAVLMPVWKNYKDITIGTTADEVKDKLGKAKITDKDGFYYEFSDDESAQIILDSDQKVSVISIIYKVKDGKAPKFEDVLGTDITIEPNANGSIYKLVRYPEAGYWVAYNQTAGDKPIVTVTIQKL